MTAFDVELEDDDIGIPEDVVVDTPVGIVAAAVVANADCCVDVLVVELDVILDVVEGPRVEVDADREALEIGRSTEELGILVVDIAEGRLVELGSGKTNEAAELVVEMLDTVEGMSDIVELRLGLPGVVVVVETIEVGWTVLRLEKSLLTLNVNGADVVVEDVGSVGLEVVEFANELPPEDDEPLLEKSSVVAVVAVDGRGIDMKIEVDVTKLSEMVVTLVSVLLASTIVEVRAMDGDRQGSAAGYERSIICNIGFLAPMTYLERLAKLAESMIDQKEPNQYQYLNRSVGKRYHQQSSRLIHHTSSGKIIPSSEQEACGRYLLRCPRTPSSRRQYRRRRKAILRKDKRLMWLVHRS